MNKNEPLISIVIVTHQRTEELNRCIKSILNNSYKNIELIIVNNGGTLIESDMLGNISIIHTKENLGAAEGRNVGYRATKGEYILFGDDDAHFDNEMLNELLKVFLTEDKAGIVQPIIYDIEEKDRIVAVGHGINLTTGRLYADSVGEKDHGMYKNIQEIPMGGCIWMVKKEVFDRVGEYDAEYFIPYEDSDFSLRARKAGYKVYLAPNAKAYHPLKKKTSIPDSILYIGITSPERAYRVMRNKMMFMRKHAPFRNLIFFLFALVPIYVIVHSVIIVKEKRFDILKKYFEGVMSGYKYLVLKKG